MTTLEMSNEFDLLYNNMTSNSAPDIDVYEKSVLLTRAQIQLVKAYFDERLNKPQEGFDDVPRRQIDFSMLLRTITGTKAKSVASSLHSGDNIEHYVIPDDILVYLNEVLQVERPITHNGRTISKGTFDLNVIPISYTEYIARTSKPFKRPLKNQAWRLITNSNANSFTFTNYTQISKIIANWEGLNYTDILALINNKNLKLTGTNLQVDEQFLTAVPSLEPNNSNAIDVSEYYDGQIKPLIATTVGNAGTVVELIPGNNDIVQNYIIRYVARPKPIIIQDIDDMGVSIDNGQTAEQACELDPILHEEIVQRAVELARATYPGALNDQVALGQNSQTNLGAVTALR